MWVSSIILLLCVVEAQNCACTTTTLVQKVWGDNDVIFVGTLKNGKGTFQATVDVPLKGCLKVGSKLTLSTAAPCTWKFPVGGANQNFLVTATRNSAGKLMLDNCGWTKPQSKVEMADMLWLTNQYEQCPGQSVTCANNRTALVCNPSACDLAKGCPGAASCENNACHNCALQYLTSDRKLKCGELGGQTLGTRMCPPCKVNPCAGKKPENIKKDDCDDRHHAVHCVADSCFGCEDPLWVDAVGRQVCLSESPSHKCSDISSVVFDKSCAKQVTLGYGNLGGQRCVAVQGCRAPPNVFLYKTVDKCKDNCMCMDFTRFDMKFDASDPKCNQDLGWGLIKNHCTKIQGCADFKSSYSILNSLHDSEASCKSACSSKVKDYDIVNNRPSDWTEDANGADAIPAYTTVFPRQTLKVNRIDFKFDPSDWAKMQADLKKIMDDYMNLAMAQHDAGASFGRRLLQSDPAAQRQMEKIFAGDSLPDGTCRPLCGSGGYCKARQDTSLGEQFGFNERGVIMQKDPDYARVMMSGLGHKWHNVGIRYKGGSSMTGAYFMNSQMLGFRLNMDEYSDDYPETKGQTFFGFDKLTFSNNWLDKSHIREMLAYEILGASGAKASRAIPVRVYFDVGDGKGPVFWGVYTMIEDPTDVLVRTYVNDTRPGKGNIYKPENNTWEVFKSADFEKKNNDKVNVSFSDVILAFNALHAPTRLTLPTVWRSNLEKAFDVVTFLRVLATTSVMGDWDSYGLMPHNYYLYNYNNRLTWIPWDFNLALACDDRHTSILKQEIGDAWPLISFLLADPTYRQMYTALVQWLVTKGPFVTKDLIARKNQLIALVTPHIMGQKAANGSWLLEPEAAPHTTMLHPDQFTLESAKLDNYLTQRSNIAQVELQREAQRLQASQRGR